MPTNRIPLVIACILLAVPVAAAQQGGAWHGQDNEFGSIRTPYALDMDGARVPIEVKVVLRKNYDDQDSRFFLFGFDARNTPLDVSFDNLVRTDTGAEMPCHKREGDTKEMKCFVDLKHMPEPGTEIIMRGTVGASKSGGHRIGALVLPMTYTWEKVFMTNGLPAELYGHTLINVHQGTSTDGAARFSGNGNKVPAPGAIAVVGAMGAALAIAAVRGRRRDE